MARKKKKTAKSNGKVRKPHSWEKAVMAAYLLATDHTQAEAAELAGIAPRSLWDWMHSDWWGQAKQEGIERWNSEIIALARVGIKSGLRDSDESAAMSKYVADRMIPELAPPKVRQEVSVSHEGWLDELDKQEDK